MRERREEERRGEEMCSAAECRAATKQKKHEIPAKTVDEQPPH
jgi:hypothetical protein